VYAGSLAQNTKLEIGALTSPSGTQKSVPVACSVTFTVQKAQ